MGNQAKFYQRMTVLPDGEWFFLQTQVANTKTSVIRGSFYWDFISGATRSQINSVTYVYSMNYYTRSCLSGKKL